MLLIYSELNILIILPSLTQVGMEFGFNFRSAMFAVKSLKLPR